MVKLKGSKDKVKRKYKQSFARQFLKDHSIKIHQGEKQILTPLDSRLYKIRLPRTKIITGMKFAERGETKSINSYEELISMGICIVSKTIGQKLRWESGQRMMYALEKVKYSGEHLGRIPKDHYLEHDAYNSAVRLVGARAGPLGTGPWKKTGDQRDAPEGAGRKPNPMNVYKEPEKFIEQMMRQWTGEEEEAQKIYIEEAPFMITDNNEIICLPKTGDMPSILISGMKGCLTEDTLISTPVFPKGIPMRFLLNKGPILVNSYNRETKKIEPKMSEGVEFAKHADVFELITETGARIKSTSDHPFLLSTNKYKKAINLKKEDELITVRGLMKIKEIKHLGTQNTYDVVNVQDNANFIANGFVVSNTGKSFCLHSIVSRLFWKPEFAYKICILNDSSRETGTWCFPNDDYDQINKMKMFNEKPLPLPIVYFHPTLKEDYEKLYMGDVGFDITLPWKKIISNHDIYLNLKESKRYFSKVIPFLLNCKTEQDALQIMDNLILQFNMPPNTANKIRAELETLLASKMTDLSFKNQAPWVVSKNPDKQYNPFTAAMHAGLVPVLSTEYISNYRNILSIYFNYFVEDLFTRQKQDPDFLEEQSELLFVVDECFTATTLIATNQGPITMSQLFEDYRSDKPLPMAKSYNFKTKKYEWRPIEKAMRKEAKELIEINLGVSKIKCTPNHEILTPKGYIRADKINKGDLLSCYYGEDKKNLIRELNDDQMQLIYGGILGDGCLRTIKSGIFRMTFAHGIKQINYLLWKRNFFGDDISLMNMYSPYTQKNSVRAFNTKSFILEQEVPKNSAPEWLLEKINPKGIAIWYMDDGSLDTRSGCARIHSLAYDYNTHLQFRKFFKRFNIDAKIRRIGKKIGGSKDEHFYLGFNKKDSQKLFDLIGPYIHHELEYKITRNYKKYKWDNQRSEKGFAKVKTVKPILNKSRFVYNITVSHNHNYVCCSKTTLNGVTAKNCHNISQKGQRSTADMLLRRSVREGRPRRIGTLLATQKFMELPDVIKDNTTYLIVFKNPGEATSIAAQYNLGKHVANNIKDLNKHQCIAYTTEHFIVYSNDGRKRKSKLNEVFRGYSLPPFSLHKKPKNKEQKNNGDEEPITKKKTKRGRRK